MAACSSLQYSLHAGMLIQLHLQEFVINTKHSPTALPLASGLATSGGSGDPMATLTPRRFQRARSYGCLLHATTMGLHAGNLHTRR